MLLEHITSMYEIFVQRNVLPFDYKALALQLKTHVDLYDYFVKLSQEKNAEHAKEDIRRNLKNYLSIRKINDLHTCYSETYNLYENLNQLINIILNKSKVKHYTDLAEFTTLVIGLKIFLEILKEKQKELFKIISSRHNNNRNITLYGQETRISDDTNSQLANNKILNVCDEETFEQFLKEPMPPPYSNSLNLEEPQNNNENFTNSTNKKARITSANNSMSSIISADVDAIQQLGQELMGPSNNSNSAAIRVTGEDNVADEFLNQECFDAIVEKIAQQVPQADTIPISSSQATIPSPNVPRSSNLYISSLLSPELNITSTRLGSTPLFSQTSQTQQNHSSQAMNSYGELVSPGPQSSIPPKPLKTLQVIENGSRLKNKKLVAARQAEIRTSNITNPVLVCKMFVANVNSADLLKKMWSSNAILQASLGNYLSENPEDAKKLIMTVLRANESNYSFIFMAVAILKLLAVEILTEVQNFLPPGSMARGLVEYRIEQSQAKKQGAEHQQNNDANNNNANPTKRTFSG